MKLTKNVNKSIKSFAFRESFEVFLMSKTVVDKATMPAQSPFRHQNMVK